jgi:capsular exopolysaccharide synthesis family protein
MNSETAWWGDNEATVDSGGIDILGILQRRKWIVATFTTLGLILGALFFARATPVYKSSAQVLIERNLPPALPIGLENSNSRYAIISDAYKHPVLMTSPKLVAEALRNQSLDQLPSVAAGGSPVGFIRKNLSVKPTTDGLGLYNVSFQGPHPEDAGKIVNAILEQYNNYLETSHRNVERDVRELIVRAQKELLDQLSSKRAAYDEFRQSTPLIYKDGEGTNLHQERQLIVESERSRLLLQINDTKSKLAAIQEHLRAGKEAEVILAAAGISNLDALEVDTPEMPVKLAAQQKKTIEKTAILPLLLEENDLLARYGKDHPRVKAVRRRLNSSKEFYLTNYRVNLDAPPVFEEATDDVQLASADLAPKDLTERIAKRLDTYVESLKHQLAEMIQTEQKLVIMFDQEQEAAKGLARLQIRDESFRTDIAQTQRMYDELLDKFRKIEVVGDYDGYKFDILAKAGNGSQIEPNATKILPIATVLGFLGGCLVAYCFDLTDKSFHDPASISRELGVPVIGHVPMIDLEKTNPAIPYNPVVCTAHRPKSIESEAIRTIRTALFFNTRGKSNQVIQITSGSPGEGKSSVAANLAIAIANSGKTCLVLDCDLRRPRQHRLFALDNDLGLAAVVAGNAQLKDVVRRLQTTPNLSVIPCGKTPDNPSELLSSSRFPAIIEAIRKHYDFVIIDTPPVLAVSETSAISAQVDGVIFTMRIKKDSKPVAHRSLQMLNDSGAELIGVVVNGIGNAGGKHYEYGGGRYSYQAQKYGYSYDQVYGED